MEVEGYPITTAEYRSAFQSRQPEYSINERPTEKTIYVSYGARCIAVPLRVPINMKALFHLIGIRLGLSINDSRCLTEESVSFTDVNGHRVNLRTPTIPNGLAVVMHCEPPPNLDWGLLLNMQYGVLSRIALPINHWPHICLSQHRITGESPGLFRWCIQVTADASSRETYFVVGVVFADEYGTLVTRPQDALGLARKINEPTLMQPSLVRSYEIIVDTRTLSPTCGVHISDEARYLCRRTLDQLKMPTPQNPLSLFVWARHPLMAQLISFESNPERIVVPFTLPYYHQSK